MLSAARTPVEEQQVSILAILRAYTHFAMAMDAAEAQVQASEQAVGGVRALIVMTAPVTHQLLQDFHNWARTERTPGHTAHTAHTATYKPASLANTHHATVHTLLKKS